MNAKAHSGAFVKARIRVLAIATHPIQYQTPIFRKVATTPGVEFTALYLSDHLACKNQSAIDQSVWAAR